MPRLKDRLLENLRNTYCRIKPAHHGVGVFAIRDIPKDTNPFLECRRVVWLKFNKDEISKLPKEIATMIGQFYGIDKGYYYIPYHGLNGNDISFYLNHSLKPNLVSGKDTQTFKTIRKIRKGEELFIDYREYDPEDKILS